MEAARSIVAIPISILSKMGPEGGYCTSVLMHAMPGLGEVTAIAHYTGIFFPGLFLPESDVRDGDKIGQWGGNGLTLFLRYFIFF